jgi:phosphatidylglycerophosphate synthase
MTTAPFYGGDTRRKALWDLAAGLPVAVLVAAATWSLLDVTATYGLRVLGLYAGASLLILATVPDDLPGPGSGTANRVTLGRLILLLCIAGLAPTGGALGVTGRWWVIGLGTAIMVLDGVDGWMARRTGTTTPFGARFDMETDALLMLVLSVLVWTEGRAGAWVLLIGAMRYAFVAAGWVVTRLRADLPPSLRRRVVCVVQGIALLVCLGPIVPADMAVAAAAVGLATLAWSFGVDVTWLLRARPPERGA